MTVLRDYEYGPLNRHRDFQSDETSKLRKAFRL